MQYEKDLHLLRGQVVPRIGRLLKDWPPWLACGVAFAASVAIGHLPVGSMSISSVVTAGFTFASIALGACVAAIVLSLGLPGTERLRRWSLLDGATQGKSALSDLIFFLVWAALSQISLISACVVALTLGGDLPVAPRSDFGWHRIGIFCGVFIFCYALLQLIVVIRTLSEIGVLIIFEERNTNDGADQEE